VKVKVFPYSTSSVGPGADLGVQAVSLQVTVSHPPGGRLPLLSVRPAATFPAAEHRRPLADTKLCCLVREAHRCEQLAQGCYAALRRGFKSYWRQRCLTTSVLCQRQTSEKINVSLSITAMLQCVLFHASNCNPVFLPPVFLPVVNLLCSGAVHTASVSGD